MSGRVTIEIDASRELSLAMIENAVPLVARLALTNPGEAPLGSLVVEVALAPDFSATWTGHVAGIPPGGTFQIEELELPLDRDKLVNQLERGRAELRITVRAADGGAPLATEARPVDVLAYNEWSPLTVPQLLAAFVLPNHPAIGELLREARAPLERLTGSPALDGYQPGDPGRVAAIAQAIYEALAARGITYSNPPASFEEVGQKIRTPEQVLHDQVATCLDVSVTLAACLEQAGLHPLIVLVKGHAFPAVWLEDHYSPDGVVDEASTLRKLVELGAVLVFDSSAAVARPQPPFAEARRIATRHLADRPLAYALDVAGARKLRYRPLPIRVAGQFSAAVEVPVATPAAAPEPGSGPAVPRPTDGGTASRPTPRRHPRIEAWKQRLLDTTLRNRLINFKDTKQSLELLSADLGAVEDALASGEELFVRARPPLYGGEDPRSKRLLDARAQGDALEPFLRERLAHGELYATLPADATSDRLTTIYRAARTALEETGTNTLCLALGMIHWYEAETSEQARRAPILLLPVELVRSARSAGFRLKATGEDARLNVTLFEKLRQDTGIMVEELSELPLDQAGVDVPAILRRVREAILNLPRWEVKDALHLGLFSFAKFAMWADLEQNLDALLASPVIAHLIGGKGEPFPNTGAFPEPRELDARPPAELVCPLDADASQLAAVVAASEGKTFVLQGPPGTGKSQTITNLIVHGIAHGKRVLFVAEKAAALEVVQRRLAQVGLAPYVLELHSHKAGKQQVLDQFREALDATPIAAPADWELATQRLGGERQALNAYVTALHEKHPSGFSVFQALARLDRLADAPACALPAECGDAAEQFHALRGHVEQLQRAAAALAPVAASPWQGCALATWQVDLPSRVASAVERALAQLEIAHAAGGRLAAKLGANPPATLGDVDALCALATAIVATPPHGQALQDAEAWRGAEPEARELAGIARTRAGTLARLGERYDEGLFRLDVDGLAARFQRCAHAFFLFAWWGLRGAKKLVRAVARDRRLPANDQLARDLEQAREVRALETKLAAGDERGRALFGSAWQGAASDPTALEAAVRWAASLHAALAAVRPVVRGPGFAPHAAGGSALAPLATEAREALAALHDRLAELDALLARAPATEPVPEAEWHHVRSRLERWRGDVARLRDWYGYLAAGRALSAAGCGELVEGLRTDRIAPDQLPRSFERGVYDAWVRRALAASPVLAAFDGAQHTRRVAGFAGLDRAYLAGSRDEALARVSSAAHPGGAGAPAIATGGEMGTLQHELQKKRRHLPIRKLLAEIPALAARLKPCFLMSPMSVATYLDPRATPFDLVVFDEASQIPTHDAIGVLARGRVAVVVGDSKQLPPTAFFQAGDADEPPDDNGFEELESILDQCVAGGLPQRRLDWHYRSRHETLIAFSNSRYYGNRLNTFPSARERGPGIGVMLRPVAGCYDKGGARTNRAEADALVAELVARLRAPDAEQRSYGVVTFSQAQQQLVEGLLDKARAELPDLDTFFDDKSRAEPVIVKNLENIQGDERDVMLFSICYGPDQTGKVAMNFGPLNRDGGERRLNVAITRAREELVVFATLAAEQIDVTRTNARGVKDLRTFLDYAKRGPIAIAEATTAPASDDFGSPFEQQVCDRLRALGHTVVSQVGCAGYRIDLGIRHPDEPGRYVLGIECDGASYHSARSARERDRLREHVLEGLGWRIHRIWSTDWWQFPDREIEKVLGALEAAKAELARAPAPAPAVDPPPPPAPDPAPARYAPPRGVASRAAEPTAPARRPGAPSHEIAAYQIAPVPDGRRAPEDVHDTRYEGELRALLTGVISVESPISLRLLARRIAPYFGIRRATNRLEQRLRDALGSSVAIERDVVWRVDQDPTSYGGARCATPEARREADDIPLEELANAAMAVLRASVALDREELVRLTARAVGFSRVGGRVSEHVAAGIDLLVERGRARRDGSRLVLGPTP